jgi:hypothetical protein
VKALLDLASAPILPATHAAVRRSVSQMIASCGLEVPCWPRLRNPAPTSGASPTAVVPTFSDSVSELLLRFRRDVRLAALAAKRELPASGSSDVATQVLTLSDSVRRDLGTVLPSVHDLLR